MEDSTVLVRQALKNTPKTYLDSVLAQRADGPARTGSYYPGLSPAQVLDELEHAEWREVFPEGVRSPARAFEARIPGVIGVLSLEALRDATELFLESKDPSNPQADCVLVARNHGLENGRVVSFTTALVGPASKDDSTPVLWTAFPGPVTPLPVEVPSSRHGERVTREQARSLGMLFAKLA